MRIRLLAVIIMLFAAAANAQQGATRGMPAIAGKLQPGEVSVVNVTAAHAGLKNFEMNSEMRNSRLWLRGFTASLGSGTVQATGSVDWSNPKGPHTLKIIFKDVELVSALRVFDIVLDAQVLGKVSGTVDVTWSGLRSRDLRKSLQGTAEFQLGSGSVSNLDILNQVANLTAIQQLSAFTFTSGEATANIRDGVLYITMPDAGGELQHMAAKGTLSLPKQHIDMVGQLSLSPKLAGESKSSVVRMAGNVVGSLTKPKGYVPLPFTIRMAGKVEDPEFSVHQLEDKTTKIAGSKGSQQ